MRVLWITNGPIIAKHCEMMNVGHSQSGGWLVAAYDALKESQEITLGIAATYIGSKIKTAKDGKHLFFLVPCNKNGQKYDPHSPENQNAWRETIGQFKPDVIQIWGTEFPYGTCALKVSKGIPSVAYIQGLMAQIANHGDGQISFSDKLQSTTISDIVKRRTYWHQQKEYQKRVENERNIITLADGIIVENEWSAKNYQIMNGACKIFKSKLPINKVFAQYDWSYEDCDKHILFTTAGSNPIKGHHMLFNALAIVKNKFPDVQLRIPGMNYFFGDSLSRRMKRQSYPNYLLSIIKQYDLAENITFIGRQTQEGMAENMARCNVFVMPSAIENHSSTLLEAMMVGVPTISSNVGGVEEYYRNGENGLIYRFDEPEVLAAHIISFFEKPEFSARVGKCAQEQTRYSRLNINLEEDFLNCYRSIITCKCM